MTKPHPETIIKVVYDDQNYDRVKKDLVSLKKTWKEVLSGGSRKLLYDNMEISNVEGDLSLGMGFHLIKYVKEDIINSKINKQRSDKSYKAQYFNINTIKSFEGLSVVYIDINDCYWRTAFLEGYLTNETYQKGIKKAKEWKRGRVASIGALDKKTYIYNFEEGVKKGIAETKYEDDKCRDARNCIIGRVYDLFVELHDYIGKDNFLMFLTDAVICTHKEKNKVIDFFMNYKYKVSCKILDILRVDENIKKITWFDYIDNKEKYYLYNSWQTVL